MAHSSYFILPRLAFEVVFGRAMAHADSSLNSTLFQSNSSTQYLRSTFEYNSVTWSPMLTKDIVCIEKVQRRFTKRLPGLKNLTYQGRLNHLNLITLELRRLHLDLTMCYKIIT